MKILGGLVALAIAAVAAFYIQFNTNAENEFSALSLANVEALASGESGSTTSCSSGDDYCVLYLNDKIVFQSTEHYPN